jgi:hypothetical protein
MANYAKTAATRKSVPQNGQVQLRAHARAAFASAHLLNHRIHKLSICNARSNAEPYRACVSDQDVTRVPDTSGRYVTHQPERPSGRRTGPLLTRHISSYNVRNAEFHCPLQNERTNISTEFSSYSGKTVTVCPCAGLLISHSPWYRRIQTSSYTYTRRNRSAKNPQIRQ